MKKSMIALAVTALLLAFVACAGRTGTTNSAQTVWETTAPVTEAFTETAEERAAPVSETPTGTTDAVTTTLPVPASAVATTTRTTTTKSSASSTTAKPVAAPAPVVLPPVTAALTTTMTRYVPPQTVATMATTTTTRYVPPATTTTTRQLPDYEAMGQTAYQDEAIRALNAMRAKQGLAPMAKSDYLMSTCLAQAQVMAAAGRNIHSEFPPGCESVGFVPYDFPAQVLGEVLAHHVSQFLTDGDRVNVGIAVVRDGNYLYAVMQGN